jgi:N-methylhydantoinase B/acetone carboxylase alpha subunit
MVFKTPGQVLFTAGDGHVFSSAGVFGGYPGNSGYRHNVHGSNMKEIAAAKAPYPTLDGDPENSAVSALVKGQEVFDINQMTGPHAFGEYDVYTSVQRGGPGLGDPLERDPAAVAQDVNGRELMERFARSIYGVVLARAADGSVQADEKATEAQREAMRKARLDRSVFAKDYIASQREQVQAKDFIPPVRAMYASSMKLSSRWARQYRTFWGLSEDFTF